MTAISILRVDFREIDSIRITCSGCSGEVIIPLPKDELPRRLACAGCNTQLWNERDNSYQKATAIAESISAWKRMEHERFALGFSLTQERSG